jgi:hypothetical protein
MKTAWQLVAVCALAYICSSYASEPPDVQFVRQKIPVEIQSEKPLTFEIHSLSGNGVNDVGIRCSSEIWNTLTNGTKAIDVRLKSSNKPSTQIGGVNPGSSGTAFLGYISNVHYLFYIGGEYRAKATVEITFPNTPERTTSAEIIVCKTPADTGP